MIKCISYQCQSSVYVERLVMIFKKIHNQHIKAIDKKKKYDFSKKYLKIFHYFERGTVFWSVMVEAWQTLVIWLLN